MTEKIEVILSDKSESPCVFSCQLAAKKAARCQSILKKITDMTDVLNDPQNLDKGIQLLVDHLHGTGQLSHEAPGYEVKEANMQMRPMAESALTALELEKDLLLDKLPEVEADLLSFTEGCKGSLLFEGESQNGTGVIRIRVCDSPRLGHSINGSELIETEVLRN